MGDLSTLPYLDYSVRFCFFLLESPSHRYPGIRQHRRLVRILFEGVQHHEAKLDRPRLQRYRL